MFMGILAYGQWVAYGVVEEKAGRIIEVVLSAVSPRRLLAAKVTTIGLMGLGQMMLIGLVVLVIGGLMDVVSLPAATFGAFFAVVLWFLLGYAFYASGYAASGALVRATRDASDAVGGFNLLLMFGYFTAIAHIEAGDTVILKVASFLPPWAPMTMPVRMVRGFAAWWEVVAAALIMLIATYAMIRLAARVYVGGIIRVGSKVKWREAYRSAEG
jgi:ABC-2 type transport system permease protein